LIIFKIQSKIGTGKNKGETTTQFTGIAVEICTAVFIGQCVSSDILTIPAYVSGNKTLVGYY